MSEDKKKVPKLRFPGFEGEWEERKLSELGESYAGLFGKTKTDFGHGEGRFVTYMNVFRNPLADITEVEQIEIDNKQNQVKYGDVFFTISSETPTEVGMSSVWLDSSENVYLNSFCFGYRLKQKIDYYYFAYMLRSSRIRKKFVVLAQGISRYNISKNKVMEINVPVTSFAEQYKIGEFIKKIESLISIQSHQVAKLTRIKTGLLKKMFPQNGENTPEIRYPGFSDEWSQYRFGDLGTVAMNKRIYKEQTSENGEIPFYKIGTFGGQPDAYISRELFEEYREKYPYPQAGDILISASGSIGRTVEYTGRDEYFQDSNIVWFNHDDRIDNSFLKCFYAIVKWYGIEGTTIKRLYNDNILKTIIWLPSIEEQRALGRFFRRFDEFVESHQKKLKHLQRLKQGLLQQMFV